MPATFYASMESRYIAKKKYNKCFASDKHEAITLFKFELDTLELFDQIVPHVLTLFTNLTLFEKIKLKHIAIHEYIQDVPQPGGANINIIDVLNEVSPHMPRIKNIEIVSELGIHFEPQDPAPRGLLHQFYDQFPYDFYHYCELEGIIYGCSHQECQGGGCQETIIYGSCPCFHQPKTKENFNDLKNVKLDGTWEWRT